MNLIVVNAKAILFGVAGVAWGMYVFDSFRSLSNFVISVVIMVVVCATASYLLSEMTYEDEFRAFFKSFRGATYVLVIFVLFGVTWIFAAIMSAPVEPGDEIGERMVATHYVPAKSCDENRSIYLRLFALLVSPTLIGVRVALGPRRDSATETS